MSCSYYAYVLYGVKLDPAKFGVRTDKVRGCAHPEPAGKFCGDCGEPAWKTEEVPVLATAMQDFPEPPYRSEPDSTPQLLDVADWNDEAESRTHYVGMGLCVSAAGGLSALRMDTLDQAEALARVRASLALRGLWTDSVASTLGTWVVGRISY